MAYDVGDFSKGIVTDVSSEDAGQGSLGDAVNLDMLPGRAITRYGTKTLVFTEYTYDYATRSHTMQGTFPQLGNQELIQVIEVKAPDARAGSIRGFASAKTFSGTPEEHCLNDRVTAILIREGDPSAREYSIYIDAYERDKFVKMNTFGSGNTFNAPDDSVPFIIPRQSSFAIGNVYTSQGERGVIVFQHVKGLYCWTRRSVNDYGYLSWLDEWRCTDSERYDAAGQVQWMLYVSNVERAWNHESPMALDFAARYGITYEQAMKEILSPHELGGRPANFNIKVTAIYNGFQESRPLPFKGGIQYNELVYENAGGIEIQRGISSQLPDNWVISTDGTHGRFARVRMNPIDRRCAWAHTFDRFPPIVDAQNLPGNTHQYWYLKLLWNQPWYEGGQPEQTGEGFQLFIENDQSQGLHGNGFYTWEFVDGRRVSLTIHSRGTDANGATNGLAQFGWILFLLGSAPPFGIDETWFQRNFPGAWAERAICRQLFTVAEEYYYTDPSHTYVGTSATQTAEWWERTHHYDTAPFDNYAREGGDFGLEDYSGRGVLAVLPYFPHDAITEGNVSTDPDLSKGTRALTGFRIYVKEDDVDIDYRLVREIRLDHNPEDINFGGSSEAEGLRESYRDRVGTKLEAPVWQRLTFPSAGLDHIIPFYQRKFIPSTGWASLNGLSYRGGLCEQFIISDDLLTDRSGDSLLSQNMQRDENVRDNPMWIRGAVCEGRTLGIRYTDKQVSYAIVGGGVAQHDIMPEEAIRVGTNDNPIHIVSWRDSFHLVFTDRAIYRFDMADGDEMHWRVLTAYADHGTEWWRSIISTTDAVYYVNKDGIWAYAGASPQDITWGFWKKKFRETYAETLNENNCFAGVDTRQNRILFNLNADQIDNRVWVFDQVLKAWWKYMYRALGPGYVSPKYMTMHNNVFLLSFGADDLRTVDFVNKADGGFPQQGFTQYLVLNMQPPVSQVELAQMQYIGFRYIAKGKLRYKLSYGPYDVGLEENWFPYKAKKSVYLPNTRTNFINSMPEGVSRLWRVMVGQGSAFFDKDGNADTDLVAPVEINLISIRGARDEQWGNT